MIEEVGVDDENDYHRLAKTDQSSDFDRFLLRSENTDNIPVLPKSNSIIEVLNKAKVTEETRFDLNNAVDSDLNASKSEDTEIQKDSVEASVVHEKSNEERNELKTLSNDNLQTTTNGHLERKSEGIPLKPQNACQFQAHWKMLKRTSLEFFLYFMVSGLSLQKFFCI